VYPIIFIKNSFDLAFLPVLRPIIEPKIVVGIKKRG